MHGPLWRSVLGYYGIMIILGTFSGLFVIAPMAHWLTGLAR